MPKLIKQTAPVFAKGAALKDPDKLFTRAFKALIRAAVALNKKE